MQQALRLLPLALLLWTGMLPARADDRPAYQQAFSRMAPELRYFDFVWVAAEGDLNGDGLPDVAMVLAGRKSDDADWEERLVVLAGSPDGGYRILSISGDFCHPGKFYNLEIRNRSLFVNAVESSDAVRQASRTLQFRYDPRLDDLELIGEDTDAEIYEEGTRDRTSSNFLTGKSIHVTTRAGKTKTTTVRIAHPAHPRLDGYVCRS